MWMIWVSAHRGIFFGIFSAVIWMSATFWYFRVDIKRMLRDRRSHTWTVDMEAKTGKGGLKKSDH